jgi:probable lipoprotein NlpC
MRALLIIVFIVLGILKFNAQSKVFIKLNDIYKNNKPSKLLKKALKANEKDKEDPVPYYFISLANYSLYKQSHNNSNLSRSIIYLKKANKLSKDKIYWNILENDFANLKHTISLKVNYYSQNNKQKALKYCENYYIIFGDSLANHKGFLSIKKESKNLNYNILTKETKTNSSGKRDSIKLIASKCIGSPYKWAGESPSGFDCSGFVKYVYNYVGIKLPHNANRISYLGKKISEKYAKTGDIILFGRKNDKGYHAYHTGIIYENNNGEIKVIHSISKGVHISSDYGKYWKERTLFITNVIDYPLLNNELILNK